MKKHYLDILSKVKRRGMKDLIAFLESSDFFESPTSTIYHGAYPGGLLEHSLNVYHCMQFEYDNLRESDFQLPEIPEESMILVSLLHDVCKANTYMKGTRNVKNEQTGQWEKVPCYRREPLFAMGHGGKSVFILQRFIQLSPEEAQAIFWHMGAYDLSNYMTMNELSQAYKDNLLAFLLNCADMKATYICENSKYGKD